ncbi:hypothetical protein CM15mP35_05250 [bacterium]|nr:MAG: hypothetical protein CM15mP35_05250 [bacterium]
MEGYVIKEDENFFKLYSVENGRKKGKFWGYM